MTSRRVRGAVLAALVVLIAVQTWLLYSPTPPAPPSDFSGSDLVAHVVLFGAPTALLWWLWPRWWSVVVMAAYAPASELLQRLVPNRSSDVADAVADLIGVAVGLLLAWLVRRRIGSQGSLHRG